MTRCVRLAVLAVLSVGGSVHAETGSLPQPEAPPAASTPPDEPLYAAPTRLDRIGRIAAPVMINGCGPFRMILDTGANQSVITGRLAATLGLTPGADSEVKLNGVTGSILVPTVRIDSLATGELIQRQLRVAVMDDVMGGADGILGTQGFADKRITVDFANDRIHIAASRRERARWGSVTLPAQLRFGRLLVVDGRVGRIPVKAVIDTGAQNTLGNIALRDALARRNRIGDEYSATHVIGLDETPQQGHLMQTPKITLGGIEIANVPVIYGDIHVFELWELEEQPALLIGMDVLGLLQMLVIDYRRKELQVR